MVTAELKSDADELEREIVQRLMGLTSCKTGDLRDLRRQLSARIASLPPATVIQLALQLLDRRNVMLRFLAYELVHYHRAATASLNSRNIELLGKGIDSWGAVDTFACYLSGPAWRDRQIGDSLIAEWANSKDRWWRRAAVVSTVPLNNKARGGSGDTKRTLQICRLLINDRDDMVVKALSWALRELSKRDAPAVKTFVSENQTRLSPRILREVKNKLDTGLKNPKRHRP